MNEPCELAPASLPADQVYTNLTNIIISIDFDALEVFQATALIFEAGVPFYPNEQHNFSTSCLALNAAKKTLAPAAEVELSQIGFSNGKSDAGTNTCVKIASVLLAMSIAILVPM